MDNKLAPDLHNLPDYTDSVECPACGCFMSDSSDMRFVANEITVQYLDKGAVKIDLSYIERYCPRCGMIVLTKPKYRSGVTNG